MSNPSILIRIAANSEELRKNLKEDKALVETTAAAMNRLVTSFQGEKLVQHANSVTAAIHKVGVSTLSTAEAGRQLSVLDKAMDKMLRTSEPIPPLMMKTAAELRRAVQVSDLADASVNRISQGYRQFDGILQSLGINIGPYVKGLEDVTNLITKGIPGLGAFGVAAGVIAAAIGGWKLGEKIGEVTGWTNEIARGTAVLKGYGDVAQQTKLAQVDALELAEHAKAMWKLQTEQVEAATKAAQEHAAEMQREGMVTAGNAGHMMALANQLDAVRAKRKQAAIEAFKASQATVEDTAATRDNTTAIEANNAALEEREASIQRIEAAEKKRKAEVDAFMNAPTLNDRAVETHSFDVRNLTQTDISKLNTLYDPFNKGGNTGVWARLKALEASEGTYAPKSYEQYSRMMAETLELAQLRMWAQGQQRPPGFANGVRNFSGGMALVGERGPELVNLPRGADVIPNHQIGGGTVVNIALNLSGIVGNQRELGQYLSTVLMAHLKGSAFALPSPGVGR